MTETITHVTCALTATKSVLGSTLTTARISLKTSSYSGRRWNASNSRSWNTSDSRSWSGSRSWNASSSRRCNYLNSDSRLSLSLSLSLSNQQVNRSQSRRRNDRDHAQFQRSNRSNRSNRLLEWEPHISAGRMLSETRRATSSVMAAIRKSAMRLRLTCTAMPCVSIKSVLKRIALPWSKSKWGKLLPKLLPFLPEAIGSNLFWNPYCLFRKIDTIWYNNLEICHFWPFFTKFRLL